jgi:amino acid permease
MYGFLWAYSSVFGNAMSQLLPLGFTDDYLVWLAIFAIIVLPMSLLNLSEQATIQVFLSACRIVMLLLMVVTPLAAALFGSGGDLDADEGPVPHFGTQTQPAGSVLVDFGNFHKMFPAIVFSLLFHQAVPGLADEMVDKKQVGLIFGYTFALCGLAYSTVGIVGAWYFGDRVYSSANINWGHYHGGTGTLVKEGTNSVWVDVSLWAQLIKIFVVSFPAIDVISAFPIYAYVLGNTLMGIIHANNIQEVQVSRTCRNTLSQVLLLLQRLTI